MTATTVTPLASYRNERRFPFCPGCGHGPILDHLNRALVSLALDPGQVVIVSDIGCSGLSDQYFRTSAFHGLHGRSLTYATGIKLARPELKVVVIMGDGGTGIGGAHLLAAARRNVGLTLLVLNNFNFGMTGGQHSGTTPIGAITTTTPGGNLERPLDLCATVAVNGAGYVWRGTSFDDDLSEHIARAIRSECFALLDVWELCTAYFVPENKASRKTLAATAERLGLATGLLRDEPAPEYAAAYREACRPLAGRPTLAPRPVTPLPDERRPVSTLRGRFSLSVAGSAGGKVRSAASTVARAAILSGLWAAQRDDYPITVKTGHSVSELVLDTQEIHHTGIERPDALLVLSPEGLAKAAGALARMEPEGRVFVLAGLPPLETRARVSTIDLAQASIRVSATSAALYALARAVRTLDLLPPEALEQVAARGKAAYRDENLRTIRAAHADARET